MRKWLRKIFWGGLVAFVGFLALVFGVDALVDYRYKPYQHTDINELESFKVGLVLGTGRNLAGGRMNLYYRYRMEAAARLYFAGKVEYLLLSGDNGTLNYNEPANMKRDLMAKGIPSDRIYLDYAGFRTLDSVIRCRFVFGQQRFLVVSQAFHNARAVYIARRLGIDAEGFDAQAVPISRYMWFREKMARLRMVWDLLRGTSPKFLGKPVEIGR